MISVRVNEIFNYLSTDRKKVQDSSQKFGRIGTPPTAVSTGNSEGSCCNGAAFNAAVEDDRQAAVMVSAAFELPSATRSSVEIASSTSQSPSVYTSSDDSPRSYCSVVDLDDFVDDFVSPVSGVLSSVTDAIVVSKRDAADAVPMKSSQCKTKNQAKPDSTASSKKNSKVQSKACTANEAASTNCIESQQPTSEITGCLTLPKENAPRKDKVESCKTTSRKKRNRRNQERVNSATTLDFRITNNVASGGGESDGVHNEKENSACSGSKNILLKPSPESACNDKANDELCSMSGSDKCVSGAPNGCDRQLDTVIDNLKSSPVIKDKPSTGNGVAELDSFDQDAVLRLMSMSSASIMDTSKLDSLDSFDDFFDPPCRQTLALTCASSDSNEQWTEVNRRCKKIIMSTETYASVSGSDGKRLENVSRVSGAHIDTEMMADKVVIAIKGSNDQIQAAYNFVAALANRPSGVTDAHTRKKNRNRCGSGRLKEKTSANLASADSSPRQQQYEGCSVRMADTSKYLSTSVVTAVASTAGTAVVSQSTEANVGKSGFVPKAEAPLVPPANSTVSSLFSDPTAACAPVKEYSLFDNNAFIHTVEQALGRKDCAPAAITSRSPRAPTSLFSSLKTLPSSSAVVDQALLAKAPGYRSNVVAPTGIAPTSQLFPSSDMLPPSFPVNIQWERRARKYSDSSSSGHSSEDSGVGSIVNGFSLPQQHLFGTAFGQDHADFQPAQPSIFGTQIAQDLLKVDQFSSARFASQNAASGREQQLQMYSTPDKPMTLPRICSDLNPNAPDFVYPSMNRSFEDCSESQLYQQDGLLSATNADIDPFNDSKCAHIIHSSASGEWSQNDLGTGMTPLLRSSVLGLLEGDTTSFGCKERPVANHKSAMGTTPFF